MHERGSASRTPPLAALFFAVIPVATALDRLLELLLPGPVIASTWQAAFAFDALAGIVAVLLFLRYRPRSTWHPAVVWCLITFLLVWVIAIGLSVSKGDGVSALALLVPVAVALPALKRPDPAAVWFGVDLFCWMLLSVSAVALVAEVVGLIPSWYYGAPDPAAYIATERSEYWIPLADLLGLDGRWAGPFGHPSLAGPVGAFLVVYGLSRRRARRIAFVLGGAAILLLAAGRTPLLVTAIGVLFMLVTSVHWERHRTLGWVLAGGAAGAFVIGSAWLVGGNTGLSGRTTIWPEYLALWRESPLVGVGAVGIWDAIDAGALPDWASHAHSLTLDALTRMGVLGLIAVLALLGQCLVLGVRAARHGQGVGLALMSLVVFGTITDTLIDWRFTGPVLITLLLAVLLAGSQMSGDVQRTPDEGLSRG